MAVRIYRDKDVDLAWLRGKKCAVIGFGAQGRAQALNLRDSRINVVVGLYPRSKSRAIAKRNGLQVFDTAEAVRRSDVIFLALPDMTMPAAFSTSVSANHQPGQTELFAYRCPIQYRTII